MDDTLTAQLEPPCLKKAGPLLIAGLRERYTFETLKRVPAQWQQFVPQMRNIHERVGRAAFGVRFNAARNSESFYYLSGVEVYNFDSLPDELICISVPAQQYAVFRHQGPLGTLRNTIFAVFNEWLPGADYEPAHEAADTPKFIERYGQDFDLQREIGDIELWVPVKSKNSAKLSQREMKALCGSFL